MQIPEVKALGRRAGHFEDDTEGDPVNENDLVMKVKYDHGRSRQEVMDKSVAASGRSSRLPR